MELTSQPVPGACNPIDFAQLCKFIFFPENQIAVMKPQ